jgi:hypothetical protein
MPDIPSPELPFIASKRRLSITVPAPFWNPTHIEPVKSWLESLLHETLPEAEVLATGTPFEDGTLLFRIAKALAPYFRPNVKMVESPLPFLAGNNVDFFLSFLTELGVPEVCDMYRC